MRAKIVNRRCYIPVERKPDQAIKEKMKVLREFYVVNGRNEAQIKQQLIDAVNNEPNKHFDIVLDRVARDMITNVLGDT